MANLELYSSQNTKNKIDLQEIEQGDKPIVFFVNGFGGCAPCINRTLFKKLQLEPISVYDLDWNDLYLRRQSVYTKFTDTGFINDMVDKVIPSIKAERKLILIGHSFGGNAILKIARQIMPRKIAFVAILDGVKTFGKRTTIPVSQNIEYFFNRWTKHPSLPSKIAELPIPGIDRQIGVPINPTKSGQLFCENPLTYSNQKEQSYGYYANALPILETEYLARENKNQHQRITHGGKYAIYKDSYIQEQIYKIIKRFILK